MTTAPATLQGLQKNLVANLGTTNLGIVGDPNHVATGGYHIGAASLRAAGMANDYSLEYALDNRATHDFACAIDIGGSPDLLMTLGQRIVDALRNQDPRVYNKIRAVNAPFDGQSIDRRYETQSPSNPSDDHTETSSDRNHIHIEVFRTLVEDQSVIDDLYSVLSEGGVPAGGGQPIAPAKGANPIHGMAVPSMIAKGTRNYFGSIDGPANSLGGYNPNERPPVKLWEQFLIWDDDVPGITDINDEWADGVFDIKGGGVGGPCTDATARFQAKHMAGQTEFPGQVWWDDWTKAASL